MRALKAAGKTLALPHTLQQDVTNLMGMSKLVDGELSATDLEDRIRELNGNITRLLTPNDK